jgi:hypothetical protein
MSMRFFYRLTRPWTSAAILGAITVAILMWSMTKAPVARTSAQEVELVVNLPKICNEDTLDQAAEARIERWLDENPDKVVTAHGVLFDTVDGVIIEDPCKNKSGKARIAVEFGLKGQFTEPKAIDPQERKIDI